MATTSQATHQRSRSAVLGVPTPSRLGVAPEDELLLLAARPALGPHGSARTRWLAERVDWAQLLWLAHRQAVLPLVLAALRASDASVPDHVLAQLEAHAAANARRQAVALEEARGLIGAMPGFGVSAIALRAPTVASSLYGDAGQRELEPIELLVHARDAARAVEVAAGRGYRSVYDLSPAQATAVRGARGATILHHHERRVRLHLHNRLTPSYFPISLTDDELWRDRAAIPAVGAELPCPSDVHLMLLVCAHGALHMWDRLAWVADLARLVERVRPEAWPTIESLARRAGLRRALRLGLALVADLLETAPAGVDRSARPDERSLELAAQARHRLLVDRWGRTGELTRARFRMAVRERAVDRARYGVGFATAPTFEDWSAVRLPNALFRLYHVVRPMRLAAAVAGIRTRDTRAPFFTTAPSVVTRMLALADVRPGQLVYDLGCGDGRIVIEAARRYGAIGVGIDLDPARIAESRAAAEAAGVSELVTFVQADAADVDLTAADVVTLWTLPALNLKLRAKLRRELRPGARIVGHSFDMGDWAPNGTELVATDEATIVAYRWDIAK